MPKTSNRTSPVFNAPLVSMQWLKYLGIVLAILSLYVVAHLYNHYGDDIFSISLTIGQHIQLSVLSVGSMLSELIFPLLFFSGALRYRSVRLKGRNPLSSVTCDLLLIVPLGIALCFYSAFYETRVQANFHTLLFEIRNTPPGEKLVHDPNAVELMVLPDLTGLHEKIDELDIQLKDAEDQLTDHSNSRSLMLSYIEELQNQQRRYQDEIRLIHFTPLYVLLFLLLGILLGYLLSFHVAALTAILIAIAYSWYYGMRVLEVLFEVDDSNRSWLLLSKIGVLFLVNATLLIVAGKVHKRSKRENL